MIPYAVTAGFIKTDHLELFEKVKTIVDKLPSGLSCHEVVARIASLHLPTLIPIRGRFNHRDHSWLVIDKTSIIIDPYPWASASGPLLIDAQTGSPWGTIYVEKIASKIAGISEGENKSKMRT